MTFWYFTWNERTLSFRCQQYIGPLTSGLLAITAFISPILMVALPHLGVFDSKIRKINLDCDVTCDGMLISFAFKLLILLIGTWGVFVSFRVHRLILGVLRCPSVRRGKQKQIQRHRPVCSVYNEQQLKFWRSIMLTSQSTTPTSTWCQGVVARNHTKFMS